MNNDKVIEAFINKKTAKTKTRNIINGYYVYKGCTLTSTGHSLINYNTVIARWKHDGTVALNNKRYSSTTSRIQSRLRYMLFTNGISTVDM